MRASLLVVCLLATGLVACGGKHGGDDDGDDDTIDAGLGGPDAGPDAAPDCVFTPTGQFNPDVECRWDGPATGVSYQSYNDVVMTPVVINLTDDDGDGDVDLDD